MSAVEARFYISGYQRFAYDPGVTKVTLHAVSRGQHNKSWASATPSGEVTMTIRNESAAAWFTERLGKEVALTFNEAAEDLCWRYDDPENHAGGRAAGAGAAGQVLAGGAGRDPVALLAARLDGRACLAGAGLLRRGHPPRLAGRHRLGPPPGSARLGEPAGAIGRQPAGPG